MSASNATPAHGKFALGSEPEERPRRAAGIVVVVLIHLVVGYALVTGLTRQAIEVIKKPLQATVVQEVKVPEPPPPPPPKPVKVQQRVERTPPPFVPPPVVTPPPAQAAPPISVVTATPPAEPPVIAPPPPPAPPALPRKVDIGIACPSQVKPEMPQRAITEGIGGVVRAQVRVHGGRVSEVTILGGPRVFHDAVRRALMQYRCDDTGEVDVIATQEIKFEVE